MSEGRSYGGVSPTDRVAQRRTRLLDAGLELFGTTGYQRVTVRRICADAHVAHRNFYEEFRGTEDLLVAVFERCMDELETVVWEEVSAGSATSLPELTERALDAFFRVVQERPPLARVVWFEVLGVSDRVEAAYMDRTEAFVTLLDRIAAGLDIAGGTDRTHRVIVLRALIGGISEVARRWIRDGCTTDRADLVTSLTGLLLAGARLGETDLPGG